MPNLISVLILSIAIYFGMPHIEASNPLMHLGLLIVFSYLLSLMMKYIRLPGFLGALLAGMIFGHNGIGFIHEHFSAMIVLIESLCIMLLLSQVVNTTFIGAQPRELGKNLLAGALSSLGTFILMLGILSPMSMPIKVKILFSLLSATFSPLACSAAGYRDENAKSMSQVAFGGYILAILLWGVFTPVQESFTANHFQIAFMPIIIGLTSVVAGFTWGFVLEKIAKKHLRLSPHFLILMAMFLIYPCCRILGFDFVFVAVGTGIYLGLITELSAVDFTYPTLAGLIVFSVFGTQLNLSETILLDSETLKLVMLISVSAVFSKIITIRLASKFISASRQPLNGISLLPFGPLTMLILMRFIPAYDTGIAYDMDKFRMLTVSSSIIILTMVFFSILTVASEIRKTKLSPPSK